MRVDSLWQGTLIGYFLLERFLMRYPFAVENLLNACFGDFYALECALVLRITGVQELLREHE